MFKHALKDIYIGKNSGQLLDPSDIEFSFYSYGRHLDEDGEIAKYPSFNLVTHTYDKCFNHNVTVQNISQSEDIDIAKAHLLCTELSNIIIRIRQNSNSAENEYLEFLFKQITDWIDEGYNILSRYDTEVEKMKNKKIINLLNKLEENLHFEE